MGPGNTRFVHEGFDCGSHEGVTARGGDAVLKLGQLEQTLGNEGVVHGTIEAGGVGPLLSRERKEPGPVELGVLEEAQQQVVIGLGLTRVPDDERGPEGGLGLPPSNRLDPSQEPVAVTPPAHAPQQALGHVLQREVEVRHARGADDVDEPVVELRGIEVQQSHARHPLGHGLDERHDGAGPADVPPVGGEILGDEDDLGGLEGVDLGEDRLDRS